MGYLKADEMTEKAALEYLESIVYEEPLYTQRALLVAMKALENSEQSNIADDDLNTLKLLTVSAIAYAEWKDIITSKMRDNKEIANLFFQLPTVQGTINNIMLSKLSESKLDVNKIKDIKEITKIIDVN